MKRNSLLLALAILLLGPFSHAATARLPVEAFASIPDVSHVSLSPDGSKIASVVRIDTAEHRGTVVSIVDLQSGEKIIPIHTDNKRFVILSLQWANKDLLLIEAKYPAVRYGNPTTETRLLKYSLASGKTNNLLRASVLKRLKWLPQLQGNIIDMLPDDDDHLLLSLDGMGQEVGEDSVIRVSLTQGKSSFVQASKRHMQGWVTDRQHRIRIGIYRDDNQYRIYEQQDANGELRELWHFGFFAEDSVWPLGFDEDPDILYVRAYHEGLEAIFKVHLSDPQLKKELVYSNPNYDVMGSLIYSKLKHKVIGISEGNGEEYTFWDKEYIGLQNGLKAIFPGSNNYITQFSADERYYIVYSSGSTEPGSYYVGDRNVGEIYPLAHRYKKLTPEVLVPTERLNYQARDNMEIEAFLTLPKEAVPKKLPMIIFPHGGPISYDNDSFDYWTQFFANRGYGVFRMNFRGSAGYGYDFMKAGLQNWGLEMQNDVEDGTRFLIDKGIADPDRICIVGASYGGYAALMGAAMTPELYRCVISIAGVTDVAYLVKSSRRTTTYEVVKQQIGSDIDALYQRSPLSQAAKITVPVLLVHGSKDRVVRVKHSQMMYDELESLNKDVEFIELEAGDHHLSNNEHRLTTFKAMDHFLAKYLQVNKKG
ncbi:alpha/beta hydrolase family protein [Shewanella salipaludis]|uniref:S9 family peptidase n=1 Tax=Shewanella salipaludis TaxID=2723052 RepID=A0A972G024_9GAMM|nr:S9 family peptidase [Shewanella salipaludis]NMH65026.1 S9 family peptidase [Shewanella salipaludis]